MIKAGHWEREGPVRILDYSLIHGIYLDHGQMTVISVSKYILFSFIVVLIKESMVFSVSLRALFLLHHGNLSNITLLH